MLRFQDAKRLGEDAIALYRKKHGLLSADEIRAIRERVSADLDAAVAFAEQSPFPDPKDLLVDMFAD